MQHLLEDIRAISRAFELIFKESFRHQRQEIERIWDNSSVKSLMEEKNKNCKGIFQSFTQEDIGKTAKEAFERASMIGHGLKAYTTASVRSSADESVSRDFNYTPDLTNLPKGVSPEDLKISELHHKDKELIEKLEKEYEMKLKQEAKMKREKTESEELNRRSFSNIKESEEQRQEDKPFNSPKMKTSEEIKSNLQQPAVKKYVPKKQQLNPEAKQRKVPSSRLGRMVSFGSLAAGLGVGAIAEAARRGLGIGSDKKESVTLDQLFLTEANAERIVNTLCKVRGAALKIGQILSIQDNTILSPTLQKAFERVRQSADFMPTWQVQRVLVSELGPNWKDKLVYFEEKPFAAASIGQVHRVQLKDGRNCAMKIQYPGVAEGIESDINNLVGVLKIWNVFPKGLFIDNLVEVAKRELAWEVDYTREAICTKKFKNLLEPFPDFVVPDVIDDLTTSQVFTTTLVEGMPVDQCSDLEVEHRERISKLIMQLCLREIFEFRCMQTDPNWSNFFYDPNSQKLYLLDFGATRSYEVEFVRKYIEVIKAAADGDKERVIKISQEMGFLTGYESKSMEDAHANAVMILAEVFSSNKAFDFGQQDTTKRIQKLVPTIVAERLCPPPEEIYSLHRKLSGVFLLCAKYKVKISCREMFLEVYNKFKKAHG